jgi:hypothetical protein
MNSAGEARSWRPFATALMLALSCNWPSAYAADTNIAISFRGCQAYASWCGSLVWASDVGASKERARIELVHLDEKRPFNIYALILKNLDALWETAATPEQASSTILQDCVSRRGMYHIEP